jgi:hypothetical protein
MSRTYWYRLRKVGILDVNSVQGWQTTEDEEYVLAELKKNYAGRLAQVYYLDENDEKVILYNDT